MSNLRLLVTCWAGGVLLGVGSVFALGWNDSYERTDSLVGMALIGTVVGVVVGVLSVATRVALRSRRQA